MMARIRRRETPRRDRGIDAGHAGAAFGPGALSPGPSTSARTPFTPSAKRALQAALRQAVADGDRELRAEHLLLGLLADHGVTAEALRVR